MSIEEQIGSDAERRTLAITSDDARQIEEAILLKAVAEYSTAIEAAHAFAWQGDLSQSIAQHQRSYAYLQMAGNIVHMAQGRGIETQSIEDKEVSEIIAWAKQEMPTFRDVVTERLAEHLKPVVRYYVEALASLAFPKNQEWLNEQAHGALRLSNAMTGEAERDNIANLFDAAATCIIRLRAERNEAREAWAELAQGVTEQARSQV